MDENARKLRVLIAEDEPSVLLGFQAMVSACGAQVIGTAMDGFETVEKALDLRPDVIMLDINMPGMDGLSALEKINETVSIPAVVITGYRDHNLAERAEKITVYGYLHKPVDEKEIQNVLQIVSSRFHEKQLLVQERDSAINALKQRKLVERAKAVLIQEFGLSEPDAMKALQTKAKNENKKLYEVAQRILYFAQEKK